MNIIIVLTSISANQQPHGLYELWTMWNAG